MSTDNYQYENPVPSKRLEHLAEKRKDRLRNDLVKIYGIEVFFVLFYTHYRKLIKQIQC